MASAEKMLCGCPWDMLCLAELAHKDNSFTKREIEGLCDTFPMPLTMRYFEYPGREDAIAILYAINYFDFITEDTLTFDGAVTLLVDLREKTTGLMLRVLAVHQWHPVTRKYAGHLQAVLDFRQFSFSSDGRYGVREEANYTVLAGDFNEDANKSSDGAQKQLVSNFKSADRKKYAHLPQRSTSNRKLHDFIWVNGAEPYYDAQCQRVITLSHKPCTKTGMWPSDHGIEAVQCIIYVP